jgi:hypothetical protein
MPPLITKAGRTPKNAGSQSTKTALAWLAAQSDGEVYLQADSAAGARRAAGLRLLVELGFPGGQTGRRTIDDVVAVARAAGDRLVGITWMTRDLISRPCGRLLESHFTRGVT